MVPAHPAYHFSPFAIPVAVTAAVLMLFAIPMVLTRFSRTSVAMFGMALAAAAWYAASAFMLLAVDAPIALIWAKAACACFLFIAAAAYQFIATLLDRANHRRIVAALEIGRAHV